MQLSLAHAVLYVKDLAPMLDFYTNTLGLKVTDRGAFPGEDNPEIVFLSIDPQEHHQIAMITSRKDEAPSNSTNHVAFRVADFEDVTSLNQVLQGMDGINCMPISHGNALSIYFNDPEKNGIEVFWDTPWHVQQPQGKPWDPSLGKDAALDWVKENFSGENGFEPLADYFSKRHLR